MWASGAYGYLSDFLWWYAIVASLIVHTWCFFRFFPRERHPRIRIFLGNGLIFACLLSFAGLFAETYFRFLCVETDAYGVSLAAKRWHKVYADVNSMFCRDVEWTEAKPADVRRIAFLGDSFTYGWGINDPNDRFTELLQQRFNRRGDRVEVMNVAWADWDTRRELAAAESMIEVYDVDEIVLCYLPNDIDTLLPTGPDRDPRATPKSTYVNVESSFLLDQLFHRVWARRLPIVRNYCDWLWDGYMNPEVWRKQAATLEELITLCRDRRVTLRVALFPFIKSWGERFDPPRVQSLLKEFFESRGVATVDLLPAIDGHDADSLVVNSYDPHPNERANALFADAIWKAFYADPRNH